MITGGILDITQTATIQDAIWNSLHIRKGSFFQRPSFGSDLYLLKREKQTDETLKTAKKMVVDALKWLTDSGRLSDLTIATSYPARGKLLIQIQGKSGNDPVTMEYFVPVGAPLEIK